MHDAQRVALQPEANDVEIALIVLLVADRGGIPAVLAERCGRRRRAGDFTSVLVGIAQARLQRDGERVAGGFADRRGGECIAPAAGRRRDAAGAQTRQRVAPHLQYGQQAGVNGVLLAVECGSILGGEDFPKPDLVALEQHRAQRIGATQQPRQLGVDLAAEVAQLLRAANRLVHRLVGSGTVEYRLRGGRRNEGRGGGSRDCNNKSSHGSQPRPGCRFVLQHRAIRLVPRLVVVSRIGL